MDTGSDFDRLSSRWQEAEAKIYPLVMVDAQGYEGAVTAVARVVDLLRLEAHAVDALGAVAAEPEDLADRAGVDAATLPGGLTAAIIVDAACATRYREIAAQALARRRADALETARGKSEQWADVRDATGRLERLDVPELRVDVASGAGVHTALTAEAETADPVLLLMPVLIDSGSGAMTAIAGVEPRTVACDRSAWSSAAAGLLEIILDPARGPSLYRRSNPATPPEG